MHCNEIIYAQYRKFDGIRVVCAYAVHHQNTPLLHSKLQPWRCYCIVSCVILLHGATVWWEKFRWMAGNLSKLATLTFFQCISYDTHNIINPKFCPVKFCDIRYDAFVIKLIADQN